MRCICFLAAILLGLNCRAQGPTDPLTQGVQAFKAKRYAEAADDFRKAVDADPGNSKAHLYLGTSLEMQYVPGADDAANLQFAHDALAELQKVLDLQPDNKMALASIASLYYNEKKFDEATAWNQKVIEVDPSNKEGYYTLGVIAWTTWLPVDRQARIDSQQGPTEPGPIGNVQIRAGLRATWLPRLDEGVRNMEHALGIDPIYSDAMAHLNLLIRYRADLDDTAEQYKRVIELADVWMEKSMGAKRAESGSVSGVTPANTPSTGPIRIGSNVAAANLVTKVDPVYPPLAREARVSGKVRFSVTIDPSGRVEKVALISGHPLLVQAAREAVEQYVYTPALLNGEAVRVQTSVDVLFELSQ